MDLRNSLQLTDLYQLTMLQGYLDQGMNETAVFDLFVRKLPANRNFLVAAGLESLLGFLETARFSAEELDYIERSGFFRPNLIEYLKSFRFTGDVDALPEGTLFFGNEPMVRVTAPLLQAQLIETRLINLMQLPTLVASKAARCRLAAGSKLLVDFGLRRAHGAEAGIQAARSAYIGGFDGTSNVMAGQLFGVPIMGTMAHSFIEVHDTEREAFAHFAASQPDNLVLLIDTYDTERGAERVAVLADKLRLQGKQVKAVRIDSGDLGAHALRVREILDRAGHSEIGIFASSSVDEYLIAELAEKGAPINGYGIGTHLTTSEDAPYLNCAYKLQEYAGVARRKRSPGKATWPGRKQVYRFRDGKGQLESDLLCLENEHELGRGGEPLLRAVMRNGHRCSAVESLVAIRERVSQELAALPAPLLDIRRKAGYEPHISAGLQRLAEETDHRFSD